MKVQELLKVPTPENYPLILKCLSAPVAVEKELVDVLYSHRYWWAQMAWNVRMLCVSMQLL